MRRAGERDELPTQIKTYLLPTACCSASLPSSPRLLSLASTLASALYHGVVWTVQVLAECITGMDGAWRTRFGNCDSRISQCTYLHSGIAAAMCLAPSSPMLLLLISKLASVPLHVVVL